MTIDFNNTDSITYVSVCNDYLFIIDTECNRMEKKVVETAKKKVAVANDQRLYELFLQTTFALNHFLSRKKRIHLRQSNQQNLPNVIHTRAQRIDIVLQKVAASLKYIVECPIWFVFCCCVLWLFFSTHSSSFICR